MSNSSQPGIHDFADAEHCVLEDVTVEHPTLFPDYGGSREPREIRDEFRIRDAIRGRQTTIRVFAEGWVEIENAKRGKPPRHQQINLRFIDAVPTIERHYPINLLKLTGIMAALAAVTWIPAALGWFSLYSVPTAIIATIATIAGLWLALHGSHEKIVFQTLHGRADAICLNAGLGTIRQFQKIVPRLVEAIADAAQSVHEETAIYLRAEMREHYRLANEGVLSEDECAASTGRILQSFGGPI